MTQLELSIIVPTYNSAANLRNFLASCTHATNKNFQVIINDDQRTDDKTASVITAFKKKLNLVYIHENTSMAQGRLTGAEHADAPILLHLDSDMELMPSLVQECIDKLDEGYDALVIPEESFGTTFWARCKWLEKKCYNDIEQIESLRCVKTSVYNAIGGHDPRMVFSEDKDLDIRVRATGAIVGRTQSYLRHNEGNLKLMNTIRKKEKYSNTANIFATQHPDEYAWQINILNRYIIYLKNGRYALSHPLLYVGMIFLKTAEFASGAFGLITNRITKWHPLKSQQ